MSGVFSTASQAALQYLPSLIWHEQFGCAHFLVFTTVSSLDFAYVPTVAVFGRAGE
jgi:hypothetical protein